MAARSGASNARAGSMLLVVHDFIARSPDELSLAKGDRIELIERDDDFGDGWFLGKHLTNGNSGLFPEVYTTPAPKGTLTTAHRARPSQSQNDAASKPAQHAASLAALSATSAMQHSAPNPTTTTLPTPISATDAQPHASSAGVRSSLPNAAANGRTFTITSDSPVMSETLSVIDEHITDMKSPRASLVNSNGSINKRDTMSSVYSTQQQPLVRRSYIAGHETDEEEHQTHTVDEVMSWSPARVAEYLDDHGVEKAHCDVFLDQEISGEVLLAMDQNSLFIREFELGSVGRRLKTWHKIKALQDEVKRAAGMEKERERSVSEYSLNTEAGDEPIPETGRNRSSTIGAPTLPRALTTKRQSGGDATPVRGSTLHTPQISYSVTPRRENVGMSPLQSMTSMSRADNSSRPSAQNVRDLNHSRRHSSIDSTSTDGASRTGHRKVPSIDRTWQPGQSAAPAVNGRHTYTTSTDSQFLQRPSSSVNLASPADLDRGYFSSNEVESRTRRNVLPKKNTSNISPVNSRTSSFLNTSAPLGQIADADGYRDPVSPIAPSSHQFSGTNAINNRIGGFRSATAPTTHSKPTVTSKGVIHPIVTKLDPGNNQSLSAIAASPKEFKDNDSESSSQKATPSPAINTGMFASAKAKVTGFRSRSDAVTKDEKVASPTHVSSPPRTGSSTPSTENRSMDLIKPDTTNSRESAGSSGNLMPPPPSTKRPRAKSKKFTSAYTRGLEKRSPQEQMTNCDYSGWMKKKSGSLMTTWKPRLFVLRGRRLSYYYKDDDTEEKGLIDISFHRVLPAQNETLTGLHATVTGAAGSPTSPTHGATPTIAEQDLKNHPPGKGEDDGLFIFKLVPPKSGLAKGVNFTRPTVHYFAVNSRQEGRYWMAALMKATIDRDDTGVVTTTYNQKTISLAKARARRERPPALKEEGVEGRAELFGGEESESDKGLGIDGLNEQDTAVTGAEEESSVQLEDANSIVASTAETAETGESELLSEKEREAVAISG